MICSVFMASRMAVVADGRRARTVNVQSSWFCSKRRRKLSDVLLVYMLPLTLIRWDGCLLLLRDTIAAHALASIIELANDILGRDVTSTDDAHAYSNGRPVIAQPAPSGCEHDFRRLRDEEMEINCSWEVGDAVVCVSTFTEVNGSWMPYYGNMWTVKSRWVFSW